MKLKKGDKVVVISGKDSREKVQGEILRAFPKTNKLIVEGVNIAHKHQKPRKQGDQGGIIEIPTPIYANKVQLICPKCGQQTRVGYKFLEDKTKARYCKKCSEVI
jgi:large subunit ribosomal protein L24